MKDRNPRVRLMALGYPKAGKTGMLAALVNSGRFEVGLLDFDHNPDPLYTFVLPEYRDRVSILTCEDRLSDDGRRMIVKNPKAYSAGIKAIDHWVDDEGRDWGAVKDWIGGPGTLEQPARVLACDGMTSMGEAAFRRRRYYRSQGTQGDDQQNDWAAAMGDQANFCEHISQPRFDCHVVMLSHLTTIEPRILMESTKDTADIREAKAAISKLRAENAKGLRFCPSALGQKLPPEIARFFPAVVLVDGNRNGKRVIITGGEEGMDLGVPAKGMKRKVLPIKTGLLTIFDAILQNGLETEEE